MSSIDERVVEMNFKDSSFQEGVQRTLDGLKKLKDGLKLDGAAKGLEDIGEAADGVDLNGIKDQAQGISPAFAVLATMGVTALTRLTNAAIDFGKNLVSNVMEPLFEGGQRRALNLESARYSFKMLGLDATKAMADANYAVEGTAFGLDVAAKAASQLSASQVKLGKDMKAALRGISGVAALTNSSYEDISDVFTKVAGQGRLMGDDLNRLGSRGMNAAAVLGKAFNKTEAEIRKMVSEGKISFKMFAKAMDDAYGEQAVSAAETYSGALGQMRTALARIGADIAAPKLEALRRIYNALKPAIDGVKFAIQPLLDMFGEFQKMKADSIVAMLEDIVKVGFGDYKKNPNAPLVALQEGFKNIADSILNVVKPIRQAWAEVFPPNLGSMIAKFSVWFRDFTASIKISAEAGQVIGQIFKALFTVLKFGLTSVTGVISVVGNGIRLLVGLLSGLGSIIAPLIGWLFNLVTGIKMTGDSAGKAFNALDMFFGALRWAQNAVLEPVIATLKNLGAGLNAFLNDGKSAKAAFGSIFKPIQDTLGSVGDAFAKVGGAAWDYLGKVAGRIKAGWEAVGRAIKAVVAFFQPVIDALAPMFARIRDGFIQIFEGADINTVLATINTGMFMVFGKKILDIISGIVGAFSSVGDLKGAFEGAIGGITDTLGEMQKNLKADSLLKIAIAIGVLAVSLGILAMIEPERLVSAAIGLGVAAGALLLAMEKFAVVAKAKGIVKMPIIAIALGMLAGAMILVAAAVKIFSTMDWNDLAKGLTGMAVSLGGLLLAADRLSKLQGGIFKSAAALSALAIALILMSASVKIMGSMDIETLTQGLIGVAVGLGLLVGAARLINGVGKGAAATLVAFGVALSLIVAPIYLMGRMDLGTVAQGLITVGLALAGLAVAARAAGKAGKAAATIAALAVALNLLVIPIYLMGKMDLGTLIQGMLGVAGVLAMLAIAATAIQPAAKGAPVIIALAVALGIMALAIKVISTIPMEALLASLIAFGALLVMFGFAGTILGPLAPQLLLVAAAFAVFGIALALISGAMLLFALAVAAMGPALIALVEGLKVFAENADVIVEKVPAMLGIALGLVGLGIGLAIAAIGVGLMGAALILLGVGLGIIGAVGVIGALALEQVVKAIADMLQYAFSLIGMGIAFLVVAAGLAALAIAGILVGAALVIAGFGIMILVAAIYALGPALESMTAGLEAFLPHVDGFVEKVPAMIALAAGIIALGIGGFIAALGLGALGLALVALGSGLLMVSAAGEDSYKVIKKVTEEVAALWGHIGAVTAVSAALAALGGALMLVGGGLSLTGLGAGLVIGALMMFVGLGQMFAGAVQRVVDALKNLNGQTKAMSASAKGLGTVTTAITKLGNSSMSAYLGVSLITAAFTQLGTGATTSSAAVTTASRAIQASTTSILASMKKLGPAAKEMQTKVVAAYKAMGEGVDKAIETVKNKTTTLGTTLRTKLVSAINSAKSGAKTSATAIGSAIISGMVAGINNGIARVSAAARRVAAAALTAAKNELDSHSPSREMIKLGEDSDEGLALGFEAKQRRVENAAAHVGNVAITSLKKSLSDISNAVAMDPNMRPTITPVLDLSAVRRDAAGINGIFGRPNLNVGENYREASDIMVDPTMYLRRDESANVTNVTFNQTNNSPKALSEAEVYRQTNNQVNRLNRGVGASNVD